MKYLLVYGTLRKNAAKNHNFGRFGRQVHISDEWVYGYNLHSLRYYPAVCTGVGNIFCELHEVDEETEEAITAMEKNAGYEVHQIEVSHPIKGRVRASLYVMPTMPLLARSCGRIQSGDWNEEA